MTTSRNISSLSGHNRSELTFVEAGPDWLNTLLERQFLSSLVSVIQPIIAHHLGLTNEHNQYNQGNNIIKESEGEKLISALKDFIKAQVSIHSASFSNTKVETSKRHAHPLPMDAQPDKLDTVDGKDHNDDGIPKGVPFPELETMTLTKTRAHVFNNMPIRLLSFDSNGTNIQLIDRNEIFHRILRNIVRKTSTEKFQNQWNKALTETLVFSKSRQERLDELVTSAVNAGANYAILSHTWTRGFPGDVVFQNWKNRASNPVGFSKVTCFCRVAAQDYNETLGWIDTICINKDSNAELGDSIRSMYKWYRGSSVCITYLSETERIDVGTNDSWFTRGWTLQELLAPTRLFFYNKHWNLLGSSENQQIQALIERRTSITAKELSLCRHGQCGRISFSRRLQMASCRFVTKEEDSSYSLMGLMNVNMSVAYGEGAQTAFRRLFQELLASQDNVLDLFNRKYLEGDKFIPPSLSRYAHRHSGFNYIELSRHTSTESIVLTHLGMRVQCLLLPVLFCRRDASGIFYQSKGDYHYQFYRTLKSRDGEDIEITANVLDKRLYAASNAPHPLASLLPNCCLRPTIAVLNHTIIGDTVELPHSCMGIEIYTADIPGMVQSSSEITTLPTESPLNFPLRGRWSRRILIEELQKHGMQLVTLYL